jgi:hypothetical protein
VQLTYRKEFLTTKGHRSHTFHLAISAPPQRSSRLLGAGHATGGDNHRSLRNKKCGILNALRGRKMSTNENSASESDETRSDNDVQGAGTPTSGLLFNFGNTLTFLPVLVHVKVVVKI